MTGCLYTLAGIGPSNLVDGPPSTARFAGSSYLTTYNGDLYVADTANHVIRKVPLDGGSVTTVAGNGKCGFAEGPALSAQLCEPTEVVFTPSGDMYISDSDNNRIRKLSNGMLSTLAGSGGYGAANGSASQATFRYPAGLFLEANGDLLIADYSSHRIRRWSAATNNVSTVAGTSSGLTDGTALVMQFDAPIDMVMHPNGTLYVVEEGGDRIRAVPPAGSSYTLAGPANGVSGNAEGAGGVARFNDPSQLALDVATDTLYVADRNNEKVRGVPVDGGATFPFLGPNRNGWADGVGSSGSMIGPAGFAQIRSNAWVLSDDNQVLRLAVRDAGASFASASIGDFAGLPHDERVSDGPVATANIYRPGGITAAADGTIYFTDPWSNLVRRITVDGGVQTVVGNVNSWAGGTANGSLATARTDDPNDLEWAPDGGLYFTEWQAHSVRAIDFVTGTVSRIAGAADATSGHVNGTLAASRFTNLRSLAFTKDSANRDVLIVSDVGNDVLRKIDIAGDSVTDFAGSFGLTGTTDGAPGVGRFTGIAGIDDDAAGNIWVADTTRVRKVDAAGVLSSPLPAVTFTIQDVGVDGDTLFAVGNRTIVEYKISTLTETRRFSTRFGWQDGMMTGAGFGAVSNLMGVWVTPNYLLLADRESGRIRRVWR